MLHQGELVYIKPLQRKNDVWLAEIVTPLVATRSIQAPKNKGGGKQKQSATLESEIIIKLSFERLDVNLANYFDVDTNFQFPSGQSGLRYTYFESLVAIRSATKQCMGVCIARLTAF